MPHDFLNDPDPLERQAARILQHIDRQNALENPTPETREIIRDLVTALHEALDYQSENQTKTDDITTLKHQAEILDHAFRRLMMDADITYAQSDQVDCNPMQYAAAFKAQDQYRRTIATLNTLKTKKKGYGKRKQKSR